MITTSSTNLLQQNQLNTTITNIFDFDKHSDHIVSSEKRSAHGDSIRSIARFIDRPYSVTYRRFSSTGRSALFLFFVIYLLKIELSYELNVFFHLIGLMVPLNSYKLMDV